MATESNTTRLSGSLAVGNRVLRGLLTAAVGGSVVMGGNLYFDKTQTTTQAPTIYVGTGAYLSMTGSTFVSSGSTTAPTRMRACVRNPYTGTGIVHRLHVECGNTYRAAVTSDAGVTSNVTHSGSNLWNNRIGFGTGNSIVASTGSVSIPESQFLCVYTSTGSAPEADCTIRAWLSDHYQP